MLKKKIKSEKKKSEKKNNLLKKSEDKERSLVLEVRKLNKDAVLPQYYLGSDIGLDLVAVEDVTFAPMEQKEVKTGIAIKIPQGHVGLIRDRAGIVTKMNVHTVAGTFDPGYRGEISVLLVNFSDEEVEIGKGMRIAQMIIMPVSKVSIKEVKSLDKTERGEKGFGSSGIKNKIEELEKLERDLKR